VAQFSREPEPLFEARLLQKSMPMPTAGTLASVPVKESPVNVFRELGRCIFASHVVLHGAILPVPGPAGLEQILPDRYVLAECSD
jgi:hypothetical protein